jgi:hypothetical protein
VKKSIAKRELLYSLKGSPVRERLTIKISGPYLVDESMVNFKFDPGTAGCTIEFDGLPENDIEVYGVDVLHALKLASDVEPYLKGLAKKYDLYWASGDPYFED